MRNARFLLVLGVLLGCVGSVRAHGIGAECRLRGDKVEVEAYFDDDSPAANARVTVWDGSKQEIAAGRTDAKGHWSFPTPAAGTYEVVIDAGAGHRATRKLKVPTEGEPKDAPASPLDPSGKESAPLLTDGPTREEFTRFPWEKIALGLALVALAGLLVRGLVRRTRT